MSRLLPGGGGGGPGVGGGGGLGEGGSAGGVDSYLEEEEVGQEVLVKEEVEEELQLVPHVVPGGRATLCTSLKIVISFTFQFLLLQKFAKRPLDGIKIFNLSHLPLHEAY